jgi:hypothetical protein
MGENAPAVLAPAASATRDTAVTFITALVWSETRYSGHSKQMPSTKEHEGYAAIANRPID